jgi:ribonuclease/clavin/mitogillin
VRRCGGAEVRRCGGAEVRRCGGLSRRTCKSAKADAGATRACPCDDMTKRTAPMPGFLAHTIVNLGYRSTNYWVISAGRSRLLVDLGYPGTMGNMRGNLDRMGIPLGEIRYSMATHYHPDHAGLAQELKVAGVPLLVLDVQVQAIPLLQQIVKPRDRFVAITTHDNVRITCRESRALLLSIGISGEVVHTPGHSADSVSLLLDDGSAFTGDLTPPLLAPGDAMVEASWRLLTDRGAARVYPGHGPMHVLP